MTSQDTAVVDAEIADLNRRLLATVDLNERDALLARLDHITLERAYAAAAEAGQRKDDRHRDRDRQGRECDPQEEKPGPPGHSRRSGQAEREPERYQDEHEDDDEEMVAELPEAMTTRQVAALFGVSSKTIRNAVYEGRFPRPCSRRGREIVFEKEDVIAMWDIRGRPRGRNGPG